MKTKDHFIPLSRAGKGGGENVLQCCNECNQWKADFMPDKWIKKVAYLEKKKITFGTYALADYHQIICSIKRWTKALKGKDISEYDASFLFKN